MVVEEVDRDPCGYVTVPPSVVVKVIATGRADLNGLLGIVVSFNVERERYLVHMCKSQSTMALKKEHITKATLVESYRAQWEQLQNDARVREKMSKYLNLSQKYVAPLKLSQVILGAVALFVGLIYTVGFLKTIMTTSLIALIGTIAGPDMTSGPQAVLKNFPERSRTLMEKQIPVLRGKLTNRISMGVILLLTVLCLHSLTVSNDPSHVDTNKAKKTKRRQQQQRRQPVIDKTMLEKFYSMGYEDAAKNRKHGSSLEEGLSNMKLLHSQVLEGVDGLKQIEYFDEHDEDDDDDEEVNGRRTLFGKMTSMTNVASMIYLYRSAVDLGTDQSTSLFSMGQLAANFQHHTEWWRKALLVLSLYSVLRIFV